MTSHFCSTSCADWPEFPSEHRDSSPSEDSAELPSREEQWDEGATSRASSSSSSSSPDDPSLFTSQTKSKNFRKKKEKSPEPVLQLFPHLLLEVQCMPLRNVSAGMITPKSTNDGELDCLWTLLSSLKPLALRLSTTVLVPCIRTTATIQAITYIFDSYNAIP